LYFGKYEAEFEKTINISQFIEVKESPHELNKLIDVLNLQD